MAEKDEINDQEERIAQENKETANEEVNEASEPTWEEKYYEANDKYVRLYSDFDNFRKRTMKEKAEIINQAGSDLMKDLLTVLDDFERALKANENVVDADTLKEGFKLVHHKFENILVSKGLRAMDAQGQPFDAELHDAITNIPAPDKKLKGKVVDVVEKGYLLKDKVIRYAKVVVGQ